MEHYNLFTIAVQLDSLDAVTSAVGAAKFAVYVTQLLIGDGIMVRRLVPAPTSVRVADFVN